MVATDRTRPVERLLDQATELLMRAPELAVVLGERGAVLAEHAGSGELWLRAEGLVVSARVRLGDRAGTTARAVAALRAAEDAGRPQLAARLRTDLAVCARSVGVPLTGLAALRPVLGQHGLPAVLRATAMAHLVGCLAELGRKTELDRTLLEADRLCLSDEQSDADARLLHRASLRIAVAAHRRRHGDLTGAADAARTGIGFLDQLEDREADGGLARSRLVLQLVCTLLDRGDIELALEIAETLLDVPPRATVVGPLGWLRLAVATRIHLPAGEAEAAAELLRTAVHDVERHGRGALAARLWLELAHVEEKLGRPSEAISCLHRSRAAEHTHARIRRQACGVLTGEFGGGAQAPVELGEVLAAAPPAPPPHSAPAPVSVPPAPPAAPAPPVPSTPEPQAAPVPAVPSAPPLVASAPPSVSLSLPPVPAAARQAPAAPPRPEVPVAPAPRPPAPAAPPPFETPVARPPAPPPLPEPRLDPLPSPSPVEAPRAPAPSAAEMTVPSLPVVSAAPPAPPVLPPEPPAPEPEPAPVSRRTRHDSEHGSVAAQSVLDRLGISTGAGTGGRRRAEKPSDRSPVDRSEPAPPPSPEPAPEPAQDSWLPRLRLPPSLAPFEELEGAPLPAGEPTFDPPPPADFVVPAEDPPPDAGLADLLALALAEHRAGTASAAALVKRLGDQSPEVGTPSPVNGRSHRNENSYSGRQQHDL
ncbi:hypothetical protein [Amycolatopsis suaedae]|uniref:hypothetical protein n=1 Tax=Amycolatopsis suaedae TaxID=2510978 RepID=UPI00196B65F3|nr:hypothetical protein [Amycolatopsis suaedae]